MMHFVNKNFKFLSAIALIFFIAQTVLAADVVPDKRFTQMLNGKWSFKYIPQLDAGTDANFYESNFNVSTWKPIAVPSNWELQGFAEPFYALELKDGLGLYRRTFSIPKNWQNRKLFLRFDGVAYGFEAWINGKKIGASSASAYNPHTFDVTDAISPNGENLLAVKVTTKPLGFEFDVNDDWALSGIFRDVTLVSVPQNYIEDLTTNTKLANGAADLSVVVKVNQTSGKISGKLIAPNGKIVKTFQLNQQDNNQFESIVRVENPQLWTAETPALYQLEIELSNGKISSQKIEERIGLREVSIADGVLKLNGKPIKLRGVNHHDIEPETGRTVTEAGMRGDLELMKRANINYVRTSHYPPNKRFIELCDELGFYVMDEVSIGKGEEHLNKPEYRENILGRIAPTIKRDKNRASVIIWSIGNENPVTEVELEGGRIAKKLDPSRPICYPKIGSYFAANYQKLPEFVDIYAPHYPTNAMLEDYIKNLKRPTIFTEYAHALGLATDRIQDQWELMQKTPQFAGGSIWHFHDQGILRKSKEPVDRKKSTVNVWLDETRYFDMNGNDGTDGIVYADRTPQTDFWLTRKVYAPVQILEKQLEVKSGAQEINLTVENRFDFQSLKKIKLAWALKGNDKNLQQGTIQLNAIAHEREIVKIPLNIPNNSATDIFALEVRAIDESGMQINERTISLDLPEANRNAWLNDLPNTVKPSVSDNGFEIQIKNPNWTMFVSRATGALTVRDKNGKSLIEGIYPHSARKFTMAESRTARSAGTWTDSMLTALEKPEIKIAQKDSNVLLTVSGRYPRPGAAEQSFDGGYTAEIKPNGAIEISYDYAPTNAKGKFTEAGLSIVLPSEMTEFRWVGQGPYASYPGKDKLNEFGIFHLNRDDLNFQGNRRETELALVSDAEGTGATLVSDSSDIAVERYGDQMLLSHNAVISSPGNKGTQPEIFIDAEKTSRISGKFSLVLIDKNWTPTLLKWFGKPNAKTNVFRPFYHSYDQ